MSKKTIEDLKREGWRFDYCKETRFITASQHPQGNKFSVCEISTTVMADYDDLGNIIANKLNTWGT